ncbi:MAG: V-type ATP synthase subunit F [Oscillibacter sp.]|jgi:V/A-type H+-transporting ATPase subunit F|nr:V-type ATP synthase subunit F [Oscillibacter sp.]
MKYFVITDSADTLVGLRLAGIEGVVTRTAAEAYTALDEVLRDPEIGILLVTERLARECESRLAPLKMTISTPLVIEIPDRHSTGRSADSITRYIREAIGVKL